ncbi:hypothetical protein GH714_037704 [Hevea brasiliensis]|uniref:Peptidase S8/S53 domain-containing protein n=1 Tax=Hevea brasiliensis TaxID=3981 RepID=A0A6A6LTJ0_HEVBR|nr:hypothetical protein GH714_037704 [Hevea brasiliensis]
MENGIILSAGGGISGPSYGTITNISHGSSPLVLVPSIEERTGAWKDRGGDRGHGVYRPLKGMVAKETGGVCVIIANVAPYGFGILAAWSNQTSPTGLSEDWRPSEFNTISETSIPCPQVSGIAALLKGAHQDWSPAMITSGTMTTAYTINRDGNPLP